jgi:hypothetical protein
MKTRNLKSKCACYAGGIGICLCIIFMSFGIIGVTTVGVSKYSNNNSQRAGDMGGMSSIMTAMPTTTTTTNNPQDVIISFFSGFWGEVILLFSFVSMNIGMWFSSNKKAIVVSIVASIVLYVSMYVYYSIALEIIGLVVMFFAYVVAFNYKVAKVVKLTQK